MLIWAGYGFTAYDSWPLCSWPGFQQVRFLLSLLYHRLVLASAHWQSVVSVARSIRPRVDCTVAWLSPVLSQRIDEILVDAEVQDRPPCCF